MSRRSNAVLLGSLLVALLAACSSTPPIVVGSDLDNAPFAYMDKEGKAAGRDVDMMVAIAHMLDRELVWKREREDVHMNIEATPGGFGRVSAPLSAESGLALAAEQPVAKVL